MTKKKALKLIMAFGIQRNEAQQHILEKHNEGMTNQEIVADFAMDVIQITFDTIRDFCNQLAENLKKDQPLISSISKGSDFDEDPGD